jgi:hypothetical protein
MKSAQLAGDTNRMHAGSTPWRDVLRNTATRCVPAPKRTSCALHRRRTAVARARWSACSVVEWPQGHNGRQTREANQRSGRLWMSRRQRHRRNHLSSWFGMMAAISIEGHQLSNHVGRTMRIPAHDRSGAGVTTEPLRALRRPKPFGSAEGQSHRRPAYRRTWYRNTMAGLTSRSAAG